MPIELQPVVRPTYTSTGGMFTSGDWGWLARQEYDPDAAWRQIGSSNRRGTIKGGPTYSRLLQLGDEKEWAVVADRPTLTQPVLQDEKDFYSRQLGAFDLNLADPITSMRSLADQTGMATGEDANPLAWLRDIEGFLQTKDIDMFGMEDTGAPARAADYALALPIAVWNHLSGRSDFQRDPNAAATFDYKFQADPRYWNIIGNPDTTPRDLDTIARAMVSQYADPDRNGYLVEQIRKQFDKDKMAAEMLTSGNDAIDWVAIKTASQGPLAIGMGWTALPVVGTQIASSFNPITREEREWWATLPREERARRLQDAGMQQMAKDFIGAIPALSAANTVLMIAKAGQAGSASRTLFQTYDALFRGTNILMSAGLVTATTNWALEAWVPGYEDALGRELDLTRPISGSHLAGAVNAMGYWATGTYGAWNVVKGGTRVVRATAGKGLPILARQVVGPSLRTGTGPEMELYRQAHGGSRMADRLVSEGLDPHLLELSQKRLTMSYAANLVRRHDEEMAQVIVKGETGNPAIDELPVPERIEIANSTLMRGLDENAARTEMLFRVLNTAQQPEGLFKSADDIAKVDWAKRNARTIDHSLDAAYESEYGPAWILRTTGGNDAASIEAWVRGAFDRLGLDQTKLGKRSQRGWEQTLRAVYQYEFDRNVGLMHAAIEAMPTNEANHISLVSSRHVFRDEVDELVTVLRGENEDDARALVSQLIRNKIEAERWYSLTWVPPRKTRRSMDMVNPKELADYLEEIQAALPSRRGNPSVDPVAANLPLNSFHRDLKEDGLWEIAFKPVDENGNFVSYVRTSDGSQFRSPWIDYPMTSADMVNLGNAGMLRSKWDSVFRGFRTFRLAEYQRGSLYRNLTGDFDFTATQIDEFHDRIIKAARRFSVQPQTFGTAGKIPLAGTGEAFRAEVERIADDIFGGGPYLDRAGQEIDIDWQDVIAASYRQSMKLNLTAGLTSHMKSRLGTLGNAAAWASDIAYVNVRFNLSPLFKYSEFVESLGFGAMRGINPAGDVWSEALFYRSGIGNSYGIVGAEQTYDQMLAGMNDIGRGARRIELTPEQRQAQSYMWHARNLPEDFRQLSERSMMQGEGQALVDAHGGGEPIRPVYPRSEGARAGHIDELPEGFTLDPREAGVSPDVLDEGLAGDVAFWHTTTNLDAVLQEGLYSRVELAARQSSPAKQAEARARVDAAQQRVDELLEEIGPADIQGELEAAYQEARLELNRAIDDLRALDESPIGLGALLPDKNVSVTISEAHAITIAERMRLAVRAARNDASIEEIVDHFTGPGSPYDHETAWNMSKAIDGVANTVEWDALMAELNLRYQSGSLKYNLVQQLDRGLHRLGSESDEWSGAIGLTAQYEQMLKVNPKRIGTVQVGVRKPKLADASDHAIVREGPDDFEYQFLSEDTFVIDDRPTTPIAYGDRDELLRQLRQTVTDRPNPNATERLENELAELVDDTGDFLPGMEARGQEILDELRRLDQPDPSADRIADVFGTPEHLEQRVVAETRRQIPDWDARRRREGNIFSKAFNAAVPNPIPFKELQASRLQIEIMRRDFPAMLRATGQDGPIEILQSLGIPEHEWADFLLNDRELLFRAQTSNDPADWMALFDHAPEMMTPDVAGPAGPSGFVLPGTTTREALNELYASEAWATITALWSIAGRTAADDAFRVHFFNPYRSAFERSINHPLLGVYPASWAYKAAREWVKFLFDNQTFSDLHLGMTPVVAINNIVDAQNEAFAQANPESLEWYVNRRGPFGSSLFIANLLLPGDWSSIPFPLSRTIRDLIRGNTDPSYIVRQNILGMGPMRDVRLIDESLGEINEFVWGPEGYSEDNPWRPTKTNTLYDVEGPRR